LKGSSSPHILDWHSLYYIQRNTHLFVNVTVFLNEIFNGGRVSNWSPVYIVRLSVQYLSSSYCSSVFPR